MQDFGKPQPTPITKKDNPRNVSSSSKDEHEAILESLWDDDALLKMSESWNDVMEEMSKEDPNLIRGKEIPNIQNIWNIRNRHFFGCQKNRT